MDHCHTGHWSAALLAGVVNPADGSITDNDPDDCIGGAGCP
jgi:hypothetical protein